MLLCMLVIDMSFKQKVEDIIFETLKETNAKFNIISVYSVIVGEEPRKYRIINFYIIFSQENKADAGQVADILRKKFTKILENTSRAGCLGVMGFSDQVVGSIYDPTF